MRQAGEQVTRWWWLWLVAGALWIIASLIIIQFQSASLVIVGVILGVLFLVAGVQELFLAASRQRWRWLGIAFGVIFLAAGIYALVNPIHTFVVVADLAGFLFLLVGIFWTIEAFAARGEDDLWFLGLLAGVILIVLGFWTGGRFFATRPPILLIFVAIWTLCHGFSDFMQAFHLRQQGPPSDRKAVG
jgi:uncharacterized membrane protein HdeD (DUF308 family)